MSDGAPNPGLYEDNLESTTANLSRASAEVHRANEELNEAEKEWLEHFDNVAKALEEEYRERGSKSAPSENAITSAARRENRSLYTRWSEAKRAVKKAEVISSNRRQEVSAHQSLIKSEHSEAGAQDQVGQRDTQTPYADARERFAA